MLYLCVAIRCFQLSGSWKNLRRAFQKLDKEGSGYLPLPQFRSVLQLANIVLDEDEVR